MSWSILEGDCIEVMRTLPDCSVDSIVTDPPYGLGFMGKAWDDLPPGEEWARECLRVLKPGGHLLAFGGTRTWHRLACAVEDAGFEVRDSIAWLYGQGFPKSLNVGKDARFCQCEKVEYPYGTSESATQHAMRDVREADVSQAEGTERGARAVLLTPMPESSAPTAGRAELPTPGVRASESGMEGRRNAQAPEGQLHGSAVRPLPAGVPGDGSGGRLHHGAPASDGSVARALPAPVGSGEPQGPRPFEQCAGESGTLPVERGPQAGRGGPLCAGCGKPPAPVGLGTALKPSFEPVVVARKPLVGTVSQNVLAHGTGALNIDGCRIGTEGGTTGNFDGKQSSGVFASNDGRIGGTPSGGVLALPAGRWPANVVLDESQANALDQQSGIQRDGVAVKRNGRTDATEGWGNIGKAAVGTPDATYGGMGGASRFFYVAKAPKRERPRTDDGTAHPTVKPLALMRWLVRLVTPPGGVVLEPFAGSGTTVEACILEGFDCIAIEREAEYLPLIQARITRATA